MLIDLLATILLTVCFSQILHESLRHEEAVKYDKHIFSFAIYEMAMINIGKKEVRDTPCYMIVCTVHTVNTRYAHIVHIMLYPVHMSLLFIPSIPLFSSFLGLDVCWIWLV